MHKIFEIGYLSECLICLFSSAAVFFSRLGGICVISTHNALSITSSDF